MSAHTMAGVGMLTFSLAHLAACSSGCGATTGAAGVPTTPRAQAHAVVRVLTLGVDEADLRCAEVADIKNDATISDRCAEARARAKAALVIAARSVDAYDQGSRGEVACATATGATAARELLGALKDAGGVSPPALDDALELYAQFMGGQCEASRDAGKDDAS